MSRETFSPEMRAMLRGFMWGFFHGVVTAVLGFALLLNLARWAGW